MIPSCSSRSCCSGLGVVMRRRRISRPSVVGKMMSALWSVDSSARAWAWGEIRVFAFQEMFERHPEGITEERDEDVRFHAMLFLMEDRPDGQFAFQCTEDRFGFGQLDVFLPEFFGAFFFQVGAQQVGAFARVAPGTALFN